ncbi:MAG: hypothetical protein WA942_11350 [Mycolicibacter sinensis]
MELTTSEANRLRKWGSLWLDLLHAEMVLHERQGLPDTPTNAFTRRALWESAVIAYGRMEFSDKKRKLAHDELLKAVGGENVLAFHGQLTRWRHDHVAHRLGKDFEATAVVAGYAATGQQNLESVAVVVSTWIGPTDDSDEACMFRTHVKALRDTLWETYLAPIGEALARRQPTVPDPNPAFPGLESEAERLMVTCTLWARSNGTGLTR